MSKYTLFGTDIEGISSIDVAMQKAGLDHMVQRKDIIQLDKVKEVVSGCSTIEEAKERVGGLVGMSRFFANVRNDTQEELGVVGKKFNICQNSVMKKLQPLVDAGKVTLKTAGALGFGEKVFICGEVVGEQMRVSNDYQVKANLLFSNSHDGSAAVRIGFTPIVPICANTLAMAHNSEHSRLVRVYHGAAVDENVDELFNILDTATQSFKATFEQYQKLLDAKINKDDIEKYVVKTMKWDDKEKEDWSTRRSNQYDKILDMIKNAPGATSFQGTVFSVYNGLNTYLNNDAGRNPASRANSIWFGTNRTTDNKAFENALELVG